jgi:hypothetical protein
MKFVFSDCKTQYGYGELGQQIKLWNQNTILNSFDQVKNTQYIEIVKRSCINAYESYNYGLWTIKKYYLIDRDQRIMCLKTVFSLEAQ